ELNAELNIDERAPIERQAECPADEIVAKSEKTSVLDKLKTTQPISGTNPTKKKSHEEVL
ncbi:MAG: hypothetical protein IJV76_08135, partial [Clostridia bacterium]|nr:hypothetical protein [Clostridia bacterium]